MAPKIDISGELYNKLSELAVGFDTPENVIARLIKVNNGDFNAVEKVTTQPSPTATPKDPRSFVESAFQAFFKVTPRPFRQYAGRWIGASDDNKGACRNS